MLCNCLKVDLSSIPDKTASRMRFFVAMAVLFCHISQPCPSNSAEPKQVQFDTFSGYYVSNKFEPDVKESYVVIVDQDGFDKTFGVAFIMGDKAHRLPNDAFAGHVIIGVVKRGMSTWDYQVKQVAESGEELEIRYSTKEMKHPSATFATPLIMSVPKKDYKTIRFVENDKLVKKLTTEVGSK